MIIKYRDKKPQQNTCHYIIKTLTVKPYIISYIGETGQFPSWRKPLLSLLLSTTSNLQALHHSGQRDDALKGYQDGCPSWHGSRLVSTAIGWCAVEVQGCTETAPSRCGANALALCFSYPLAE